MNIRDKIQTELAECWQISREYSPLYFVVQVIVCSIFMFSFLANVLFLDFDSLPGGYWGYLARGVLDSILFLIFSHYVIRGYLKRHFIHKQVTRSRSVSLLILLAITSIINVGVSFRIGELGMLNVTQPDQLAFSIEGKEHIIEFNSVSVWFVSSLNQFLYYTIWALAYIFWYSIKSRRELQKQMQEVRIQQLTNQLNPHFLFNTLNSIRALIFEDKDKAADLVTQLSELFRTHLQANMQPTSTVIEEWQIAQQYLDIEKVRLEERLKLQVTLDETLNQRKLPTLTMLTLVENAVKHGISPNPGGGEITVTTQTFQGERWQLCVTNTCGEKANSVSTKTGLKNTRQRLALMFGERVDFKIESIPGQFSVILELPNG